MGAAKRIAMDCYEHTRFWNRTAPSLPRDLYLNVYRLRTSCSFPNTWQVVTLSSKIPLRYRSNCFVINTTMSKRTALLDCHILSSAARSRHTPLYISSTCLEALPTPNLVSIKTISPSLAADLEHMKPTVPDPMHFQRRTEHDS